MKLHYGSLVLFCFFTAVAYSEPPFVSSVGTGPYPWTHTRFLDASDDFHFAVVADRASGCRRGVFEAAITKLNLLRPALVLSVGDFIPGYAGNTDALRTQWAEFDHMIKDLEPPFFFVPGNHDYCNFGEKQTVLDATEKCWRTLRGPTHYWFVYKRTMFLCLNSMGGENHRWGLGDEQLAWAKEVLASHPDVRWTFIFMHNPLWAPTSSAGCDKPENYEVPSRFPELEKALAGRKYTLFAGHLHEYARYSRKEMKYFILSVTGGDSNLAGSAWGEFDHLMWVSMTDSGPRFAGLALDGILADDFCTDRGINFKNSIKFAPRGTASCEKGIDLSLSFRNSFDQPLEYTVKWKENAHWSFRPDEKSGIVPPGTECSISVHADSNGKSWPALPVLTSSFRVGAQFKATRDYPVSVEWLGPLWPRTVVTAYRAVQAPTIDGKIEDTVWRRPPVVDGFFRSDGSSKMAPETQAWIAFDEKYLYVAWRCTENDMNSIVATVKKRNGNVFDDDCLELFLDPGLDHRNYYQIDINPLGTLYEGFIRSPRAGDTRVTAAVACGKDGWTAELAVPWEDLKTVSPKAGSRMGFELARLRPRDETLGEGLSQFPPLGKPSNHQPKFFGELKFE